MRCKAILTCVFLALCVILYSPRIQAQGQAVYGAVNGHVTDPSGAAIPGAKIAATNISTGAKVSTVSNSAGYYNLVGLIAGNYTVVVTATGFKTFVQENVDVNIDRTVMLDAHLQVGSVTQHVTVSGAPPMLETQKVESSQTIGTRKIEAIPTPHNNILGLLQLLPGATMAPGQSGLPGAGGDGYISVNVNGAASQQNTTYLDGTLDTEPIGGSAGVVPPRDAVQSVTTVSSNYDVEFGDVQGVVTEITTKSGTNHWHGTAYEYNQVNAYSARNPFTEPKTTSHFVWNQYGGTLGGPIKRNKVFVFGGFQGTPIRSGGAVLTTVPTPAFRQGNFSSLAATNPIFDPSTGNADGSGRTQFSGNIIPQSQISPVSANLINLLPLPNLPGTDNNFLASLGSQTNAYTSYARVDYHLNENNRFFARYTHNWQNSGCTNTSAFGPGSAPALALPYCTINTGSNDLATVDFVHIFSPSFVFEGRFGDMIYRTNINALDQNTSASDAVGLKGLNGVCPSCGGLAGFIIGGPIGATEFGNTNHAHQIDDEGNYDYVGIGTLTHGSQTIKIGTELIFANDHRRDTASQGNYGCQNTTLCPGIGFTQSLTASSAIPNSGLGLASFLLGDSADFFRNIYAMPLPAANQKRFAFYAQDTWRVTPKLTAVLGIRYDFIGFPTSPFKGGLVNFNFANSNTIISNYGYTGPTAGVRNNWHDFAPRIGIAYRIFPKTVIRTGYGRSYAIGFYGANFGAFTNAWPVATRQEVTQTVSPYLPAITFAGGPPPFVSGFTTLAAAGNPGQYPTPNGSEGTGADPYDPTTYIDQWNFTIQHQFGASTTLTTAYVGNVTRHLFEGMPFNVPPPGPGTFDSRVPLAQYGYFSSVLNYNNFSSAGYEAFQANLHKRWTKDYTLTTSFAWERAYDFNDPQNPMDPFNTALDRGASNWDRAVVLTVGHVLDLPFGRGQRFLSHSGRLVTSLVSNWQFSGVTTWMSGLPLTVIESNDASLNSDCCTLRPNRIASGFVSNPTIHEWFNPNAFVTPPLYTFGNSARSILRGPSFFEPDWSLARSFRFGEDHRLQFRWEVFDAFNNINLANPNTDISSALVGQITNIEAPNRTMEFGLHLFW